MLVQKMGNKMSVCTKDTEVSGLTATEWAIVAASVVSDLRKVLEAWRRTSGVDRETVDRLHAELAAATKNSTFEGFPMEREKRVIDLAIGLTDLAFAATEDLPKTDET